VQELIFNVDKEEYVAEHDRHLPAPGATTTSGATTRTATMFAPRSRGLVGVGQSSTRMSSRSRFRAFGNAYAARSSLGGCAPVNRGLMAANPARQVAPLRRRREQHRRRMAWSALERQHLPVARTVVAVNGRMQVANGKTVNSARTIDLDDATVDAEWASSSAPTVN
jgi:hypothetical protein